MTKEELEALSTRVADKMLDNTKEWLDPHELKTMCGFSTARQANLRSEMKIPFHKRGRYIRYKRSDIETWLEDGKVV